MTVVFLGLGSNLGDRHSYLLSAVAKLSSFFPLELKVSSVFESAPYLGKDQPNYLNQVVSGETFMDPIELLQCCAEIEKSLGRKRNEKWESRTIDIDILYFGQEIIELPELSIPHYDIKNRAFFLFPLQELAQEWIDPQHQSTIAKMVQNWKAANKQDWPLVYKIADDQGSAAKMKENLSPSNS